MTTLKKPCGVILAGGQALRMGQTGKAFRVLNDRPLIQHVINRLSPQVEHLAVSVEIQTPEFESLGLIQIADPKKGSNGPLGGLLSSLEWSAKLQDWLLLTPCDAPFLPANLGEVLMETAMTHHASVSVVSYQNELQPTFSIWHKSLLPELRHAVLENQLGGFKQFLKTVDFNTVEWLGQGGSPFFNINTEADLKQAEKMIEVGAAG